MDNKAVGDQGESKRGSAWQYCIPRQADDDEERSQNSNSYPQIKPLRREDLQQIRLEDFFKSTLFEGQFSEFDDDGIPTRNADGTEVSKGQRKKLMKKRDKHEARLKGTRIPVGLGAKRRGTRVQAV
eukprot:scaffold2829_cov147-Amphora_coffeaeformis.AAC.1